MPEDMTLAEARQIVFNNLGDGMNWKFDYATLMGTSGLEAVA